MYPSSEDNEKEMIVMKYSKDFAAEIPLLLSIFNINYIFVTMLHLAVIAVCFFPVFNECKIFRLALTFFMTGN